MFELNVWHPLLRKLGRIAHGVLCSEAGLRVHERTQSNMNEAMRYSAYARTKGKATSGVLQLMMIIYIIVGFLKMQEC